MKKDILEKAHKFRLQLQNPQVITKFQVKNNRIHLKSIKYLFKILNLFTFFITLNPVRIRKTSPKPSVKQTAMRSTNSNFNWN